MDIEKNQKVISQFRILLWYSARMARTKAIINGRPDNVDWSESIGIANTYARMLEEFFRTNSEEHEYLD